MLKRLNSYDKFEAAFAMTTGNFCHTQKLSQLARDFHETLSDCY